MTVNEDWAKERNEANAAYDARLKAANVGRSEVDGNWPPDEDDQAINTRLAASCRRLMQSVNPSGSGNTVEGYRASCSCGWRTELLPSRVDGEKAVGEHLGGDQADPPLPDPPPLPQLAHEFLERALFISGWHMVAHGNNGMYRRWQYGDGGVDVVVPIVPEAGDYDELIERAETIRRNIRAGVFQELPDYYPAGLIVTPKMADEMKRRGWREPAETITTETELMALTDGSVIIDHFGQARIYMYNELLGPILKDSRSYEGSVCGYLTRYLPATVLYRQPDDTEGTNIA